MPNELKMYLTYLKVNQAWVFLFGDQIISMGGHYLFLTKGDALLAAQECGLGVSVKDQTVEILK